MPSGMQASLWQLLCGEEDSTICLAASFTGSLKHETPKTGRAGRKCAGLSAGR